MHSHTLVYDGSTGALDTVYQFLDTINCPLFRYDDVLMCFSELIAKEWTIPDLSSRPGPRIPSKSELTDPKQHLSPKSTNSDSGWDSIEEVSSIVDQMPSAKKPFAWTAAEDVALRRGLDLFGWGAWAKIHHSQAIFNGRRSVRAIKDRAVRLNLQRRFQK
jgi:hypothetical protein